MGDAKRKYFGKRTPPAFTRAIALLWSVLGLAIGYWIWPDGITELSLDATPADKLLRASASVLIAVVSLAFSMRLWLEE